MKSKKVLFTLILLLSTTFGFAQSKVGTSGAAFLGIGIGPDVIGMGSAGMAHKMDVSALYWNPGAISVNPKTEVSFSKNYWLLGTQYDWFGATVAISDASALGFQFGTLYYGEEKVTNWANPGGTGEKWDARDLFLALTYSHALTDRFSLGGTTKYIRQQIWHETANSYALDFGLLYDAQWNGLKLGMSIANFGTPIKLEGKDLNILYDPDPTTAGDNYKNSGTLTTNSWDLPIFFRVGIVMDVYKDDINKLVVAADAMRPTNHNESLNIGSEYIYNDILSFRAGYKNLFRGESDEGFAAGFGLAYPMMGFRLKFDGSYSQREMLDDVMIYAVSIQF